MSVLARPDTPVFTIQTAPLNGGSVFYYLHEEERDLDAARYRAMRIKIKTSDILLHHVPIAARNLTPIDQ